MTTFPTRSLGEVAKLLSGGTPRKTNEALWRGDVPWLTPKDMGQWTGTTDQTVATSAIGNGTRLAPAGASFVAVRGMSLHNEIRIVQSDVPLTFNQDVKAIVANEGINPKFLYYALVAQRSQLLEWVSSAGHGTGVLETDRLKSVQVPEISWSQQTELAETMSSLDDKIELNRRMNETLEAMAQAIFRDWFVDFGPTRRKLEGATDPVTIMGGLVADPARAQELADLFPATLGDDGLPEGWLMSNLGELFELKIGRTPPRKEAFHFSESDGIPWMSIRDLGECGVFIENTAEKLTPDAVQRFRVPAIAPDTVVLSFKLTVGRVAITNTEMLSNEAIAQLAHKRDGPSAWFAYSWLKQYNFEQLGSTSSIATAVNSKSIKSIEMPVVPTELYRAFNDTVRPFFELIRVRSKESHTLASTRDLLLPKLMSGEIRLGEASELVEAVG